MVIFKPNLEEEHFHFLEKNENLRAEISRILNHWNFNFDLSSTIFPNLRHFLSRIKKKRQKSKNCKVSKFFTQS